MLVQLLGDWPVGQWVIPANTVIDGNDPQLPKPFPMNVKALDQEACDLLWSWYGPWGTIVSHQEHLLHLGGFTPTRVNG